jgi:putative MFS transporter
MMSAARIRCFLYGFQLWIPTNLQHLGFTAVNSDYTVRNAALIGLPLIVAVALLYGFWSARKAITLLGRLTAPALLRVALAGNSLAHQPGLLVIPLSGTGAVVAVLLIIGVAVAAAAIPAIAMTALIGMIPLVIGTAVFAWRCPETIRQPLDKVRQAGMQAGAIADLPGRELALLRYARYAALPRTAVSATRCFKAFPPSVSMVGSLRSTR